MYKVISNYDETEFSTLEEAMTHAKFLGVFVSIVGDNMEIVGVFGADSVEDGKCPDGVDYTWMKRRNQ